MKELVNKLNISSLNFGRKILIIFPYMFSILYLTGPLLTDQYFDKYLSIRSLLIISTTFMGIISLLKIKNYNLVSIKLSKVNNLTKKVFILSILSYILIFSYIYLFRDAKALGGIEARELNFYANTNLMVLIRYCFLAIISCNAILVFDKKINYSLSFLAISPGISAIFVDLFLIGTRRTSIFIILIYIFLLTPKFKTRTIYLLLIPLSLLAIFAFLISGLRVLVDILDLDLLEIIFKYPNEAINFAIESIFAKSGNSEFGFVGSSLSQYIDYAKSLEANYFKDLLSNFITILPNQISPFDMNLPSQNVDAFFPFYYGEMFIYFGNLSIIISPILIMIFMSYSLTIRKVNPIALYIIGSSADFLRTNIVEFLLSLIVYVLFFNFLKLIINLPEVFFFYKKSFGKNYKL